MANIFALDIETIPDEVEMAALMQRGPSRPFEAPSTYKDPAKIADYIAQKRAEWEEGLVKTCSIDPAYGNIACISLWDGSCGGSSSLREFGGTDNPDAERAMLADFWKAMAKVDGIVTFNGLGFDLRWLLLRSAILRVRPSRTWDTPRYRPWPCCDLMQILAGWERDRWKGLAEWCRVFRIPCEGKESGMDGSQVYQYVQDGRWDEVEAYCLSDTRATWDLFAVLRENGVVPGFESARKSSQEAA